MFPSATLLALSLAFAQALSAQTANAQSASNSVQHLVNRMDLYHRTFDVYTDLGAAGNHFLVYAKIGDDQAAAVMDPQSTQTPRTGATAIRCELKKTSSSAGFYFLNGVLNSSTTPAANFGTTPNAGYDLSGATRVIFWARGAVGGEKVEFFMGGAGRDASSGDATAPNPDSTPAVRRLVELTPQWVQYSLDLTGKNLNYVIGGFGWSAAGANNANGAVFLLDDIQYELGPERLARRLAEPRFIVSYETRPQQRAAAPDGDFDSRFRSVAFTYDNAVALLAFLASTASDGVDRARRIGDAFLYALTHDRSYNDGRLRDAYNAGDIGLPPGWTVNGRAGTVPPASFIDDQLQKSIEVEQTGISTGNNAWAMLGLLGLYQRTGDAAYLSGAKVLGNFIRTFKNSTGQYQGFQGGVDNPESSSPVKRAWASTEHNLDIYAAFLVMYRITGDQSWFTDAEHARTLVEQAFDTTRGCYYAGTSDPQTLNTGAGQLPLDTQSWSALAIPGLLTTRPQILFCAETNHRTTRDTYTGFDFNEDKDGVWFEGTAQMTTAYAWGSQTLSAEFNRSELRRAQTSSATGDGFGLVAASHTGTTTGFGSTLFQRQHIGTAGWNVFGQLGFNPFYQALAAPTCQSAVFSSRISLPAAGGNATVSVLVGSGCFWIVASNAPWIQITSGTAGTGSALLTFSVAPNGNDTARSAVIDVAGRQVFVRQAATFADVPATHPFYNDISKLSAAGLTSGCGGGNYCPDRDVTRGEMAVFIVRALGVFNPPTPLTQRFTDVPASNSFYSFIDQMAQRGITSGCGTTSYCPAESVTREQMSAFLMRSLAVFDPYRSVPARFNDVGSGNPFFGFIDQLALRQITFGCSATQYCPNQPVSRGQMAAFLSRAFGL